MRAGRRAEPALFINTMTVRDSVSASFIVVGRPDDTKRTKLTESTLPPSHRVTESRSERAGVASAQSVACVRRHRKAARVAGLGSEREPFAVLERLVFRSESA